MEFLEPYVMPVIAVLCYGVCYVVKKTAGEKVDRYVPLIAGVLGIVCSVVTSFTGGINTDNIVSIVCTGLVSGLAATGAWELYKGAKSTHEAE